MLELNSKNFIRHLKSDTTLEEHDNYKAFHNFKKNLKLSERNYANLDEKEIAQLLTIAEATEGRSATMEQGVLCFFYHICYEDKAKGGAIPPKNSLCKDERMFVSVTDISVFPNPAQGGVMISTNTLAVKIEQIEIYDLFGRKTIQQTLNQSSETIG